MTPDSKHDSKPGYFWGSWYSICMIGFSAVALYFLLTRHATHVYGVLPLLVALACPVMHVFMHRGHKHRGHHRDEGD